jgi:hypothetical protein
VIACLFHVFFLMKVRSNWLRCIGCAFQARNGGSY